jgi:hypothetical protein
MSRGDDSDLDRAIRQWCDDRDAEHATTGCPSGPACLHASVAAIRAVLDMQPPDLSYEHPADRAVLEDGWRVCHADAVLGIARALGVAGERRDAENG